MALDVIRTNWRSAASGVNYKSTGETLVMLLGFSCCAESTRKYSHHSARCIRMMVSSWIFGSTLHADRFIRASMVINTFPSAPLCVYQMLWEFQSSRVLINGIWNEIRISKTLNRMTMICNLNCLFREWANRQPADIFFKYLFGMSYLSDYEVFFKR